MKVRPAVMEDAPDVAKIHVATWKATYKGIVADDFLENLSVEKRQAYWQSAITIGKPQLWVATVDDQVTGWIAFGPCRDQDATPETAELWAIYISPDHWSQGQGRALWQQARQALVEQSFKTATVWVLEKNQPAILYYEASGFTLDTSSAQEIEIGNTKLIELRYTANIG